MHITQRYTVFERSSAVPPLRLTLKRHMEAKVATAGCEADSDVISRRDYGPTQASTVSTQELAHMRSVYTDM